jgi:para-nitrobenzyl esterase
VGLVFHNPLENITAIPPPGIVRLTEEMSAAWLAFIKTGDPNNAKIPHWAPYNSQTRVSMLFDDPPHAESDPDRDIRLMHDELKHPA